MHLTEALFHPIFWVDTSDEYTAFFNPLMIYVSWHTTLSQKMNALAPLVTRFRGYRLLHRLIVDETVVLMDFGLDVLNIDVLTA